MNQKPNKPGVNDFELQPSNGAPKAKPAGPAVVHHSPVKPHAPQIDDPNAFDPEWAKQPKPAQLGHGRATPARGHALPHIDVPELQPSEAAAVAGPDGPPPSEKVDFENLPAFVAQRQMLKNVAIGASIVGVLIVILVVWVVFRAGKSTYVPITEELKKDTPDIGDHFKDKK